ncbi:MAG: hypothetical protein H6617_04935 [Bdellovibrionaceae bacterium]|nr:hypothetical protein [Pseudobdellovibrionaceae bacterium]
MSYKRIFVVAGLLIALVVASFGFETLMTLIPSDAFLALVGEAPEKALKKPDFDEAIAQWLFEVRTRQLVPAVKRLAGRANPTCDFSSCTDSNPLCAYKPELNEAQLAYCTRFLSTHIAAYLERAQAGNTPVLAVEESFGDAKNPARTIASIDGAVEFSTPVLKAANPRRFEVVYFMAKPLWQKLFDPYVGFNLEAGKRVPEFEGDADLLLSALGLTVALEADKNNLGPLNVGEWEGTGNFTQMEYDLIYSSLPSQMVNPKRSVNRNLVMQVNLKLGDQVGDEGGLIWKVAEGDSYWARYWYDFGLYKLDIIKVAADGTSEILASGGQTVQQPSGTMKVEIDAHSIRAFLGTLKAEAHDSSLKGPGFVGVRGTRASLDWFWAESLNPAAD